MSHVPNLAHLAISGPISGRSNASSSRRNGSEGVNAEDVSLLPDVAVDTIRELLRRTDMVEFTVENPGIDDRAKSLWNQPYLIEWLNRWQRTVKLIPTTYCQYAQYPHDKQPHKPTSIMTTLTGLTLQRPCNANRPCSELCDPTSRGRHSVQVSQREHAQSSLSQCEKNAIPQQLTHQILATWIGSKWVDGYRNFLVIDVFAGWGSVKNAIATFANSPEAIRMVDMVNANDGDVDNELPLRRILAMADPTSLLHYVGFDAVDQRVSFREPTLTEERHDVAHGRKRKRIAVNTDTKYIGDYLDAQQANPLLNIIGAELTRLHSIGLAQQSIATWIHASPPCTTFSLAGLATHRPTNGPSSDLANEHDQLVKKLLKELALLAQLRRR